jgi:hypothetical protein
MRMTWIIIAGTVFLASTGSSLAAERATASSPPTCVDVQIGNDRSAYLNCLNDAMTRSVEHEHGTPQPTVPVDVHSPSNQVGTFNEAAARQRMGNAFGVSPVPQRPNRVFVNPLVPPPSH